MKKAYEIKAWVQVQKSRNNKTKRLEYVGNQYIVSIFDERFPSQHTYFPYLNRATKYFNS